MSLTFPKKIAITQIAKNYRRRQPHSHLMPRPGEPPANIRIGYTLYFRKLESLGYIFEANNMGLSSFV